VYGCGTLGLLAVAILRALHPGVRVLAVARFAQQARLAERLGSPLYFKEIALVGSNAFAIEAWEGPRWRDAFLACFDQGRSGVVKVLFEFADAA
jgi:threonine dehydrogenase-like Zn-dependent dehydrogenase